MVEKGDAAVIAADPEPVLAVDVKAGYALHSVVEHDPFKAVTVITDQSGITCYPDKARICLNDIVRFGDRESVGVVIKDSRIVLLVAHRVHRRLGLGRIHRARAHSDRNSKDEAAQYDVYYLPVFSVRFCHSCLSVWNL